ncbi:tRNA (adenosine(37)-N6)-dimethylallyltransferase MiaA [Natranaerofaba carboxydovora]|uniref:tRNA (adenosine(37)-N6)-dimethylallyltransferase MiaA n=1 Tax=Natranaerofaba carboxydovora TaxID=2742683 RepID=UPI001F12E3EB|nr:tRNA (adenosine(37)-N6)-dimethylallyltransferase MiaA [Natranaerofaba carboxydovora]UMZ73525.1 tRNA dimethylallyltransferase [Natranaerofaba carboxydovora]
MSEYRDTKSPIKNPPIIVIVGPTAVGKTELAISLAKKIDGEIISADSMQIYKGMDIGTAKPSKREQNNITHHMIDMTEPDQDYSVAKFKKVAQDIINDIVVRGKFPIIVGGTGLYVNALIYDYSFEELPRDSDCREKLRKKIEIEGLHKLHEELTDADPKAAERIHPNDEKRIIRALEVIYTTGNPISEYQKTQKESPYNTLMIGLTKSRDELYDRIEKRVDKMLEKGLVDEVKDLLARGYNKNMTSMQALGYKEIVEYLQGEVTFEETIKLVKKRTKRFAKRQLTWFNRDQNITWYNLSCTNLFKVEKDIIRMLQEYF